MRRIACLVLVSLLTIPVLAQRGGRPYPPDLPDAKTEVYKTVGDTELNLYIFNPTSSAPQESSNTRPAVVFFFGGGWQNGSPVQFASQARRAAERGMVAICADYRVASRNDVTPIECVEDAKAAISHVRANAKRLGIDSDRIAAAGGSAGGHLAACTGIVEGFEPADAKASSRPNALVLFNPAVQLASFEGDVTLGADAIKRIDGRTGGRAKEISPIHHVGDDEPPTLILHGEEDETVPFKTVERFGAVMRQHGNRCEVVGYKGQSHGFFNSRRGDEPMYHATTQRMDEFFVSLGWLKAQPAESEPRPSVSD